MEVSANNAFGSHSEICQSNGGLIGHGSSPQFIGRRISRALGFVGGVAVVAALWGCNTTEGLGKDIESAGDGIKDAANDAKN